MATTDVRAVTFIGEAVSRSAVEVLAVRKRPAPAAVTYPLRVRRRPTAGSRLTAVAISAWNLLRPQWVSATPRLVSLTVSSNPVSVEACR
jgi:hypothetical protein